MPFSDKTKRDAKERSHYCCVICHKPFVEVHHIIPQNKGGPDTLDNAAPLCGYCHDVYGGNPEKRKQIREMRDFWWNYCINAPSSKLEIQMNKKLDEMCLSLTDTKATQNEHSRILQEIRSTIVSYHDDSAGCLSSAETACEIAAVSGILVPMISSEDGTCPSCHTSNVKVTETYPNTVEKRECLDCGQWFRYGPPSIH